MQTTIAHFVGIDVSKATLVTEIRPSHERLSCAYTPEQVEALCQRLARLRPQLVVVEATGGLERPLVAALASHGVAVAVVNPRRTRNFARALDQLAKTDPIDAGVLAHFAEAVRPEVRPQPRADALERDALQTRRRQLVGMLAQERNHLSSAPESIKALISPQIKHLETLVKRVDEALAKAVAADEALAQRQAVLRTAKGIGQVTSAMLVALVPELGQLTHKKIARLIGVAPLNNDSGDVEGARHCWGGRGDVRAALYLPTLTATRCNPTIKAFYTRLRERGKPMKVALIASMRKFLTMLNAMVRDNTPWRDAPAFSD